MSDKWCRGVKGSPGVWKCGGHDHENNYYTCVKCLGLNAAVQKQPGATTVNEVILRHFSSVGGPFVRAPSVDAKP